MEINTAATKKKGRKKADSIGSMHSVTRSIKKNPITEDLLICSYFVPCPDRRA
jgi:hypothetical protein